MSATGIFVRIRDAIAVDLNMIRLWSGHASIETSHGYVEIDLEMKRETLRCCEDLLPNKQAAVHHGSKTTTSYPGCRSCSYVQQTD